MEATGFKSVPLKHPFDQHFQIVTNFDIDDITKSILENALSYVYSHAEFPKDQNNPLTVFLTNKDYIKISYSNANQYGSQFNAAVLLCHHMSDLSEFQKLICFVEEFVHHFWSERDESKVSKIVCSIIPGLKSNKDGSYFLDS